MSKKDIQGWLGSLEEIASYAGVSKRTIGRWISEKKLTVRHLSARKVICRPVDIDKAIESISDGYELESGNGH